MLRFFSVPKILNDETGLTQRASLAFLDLMIETAHIQGWLHQNLKENVSYISCNLHYFSLLLFVPGGAQMSQSSYPEKGTWEGCGCWGFSSHLHHLSFTTEQCFVTNRPCEQEEIDPWRRRECAAKLKSQCLKLMTPFKWQQSLDPTFQHECLGWLSLHLDMKSRIPPFQAISYQLMVVSRQWKI